MRTKTLLRISKQINTLFKIKGRVSRITNINNTVYVQNDGFFRGGENEHFLQKQTFLKPVVEKKLNKNPDIGYKTKW